MVSPRWFVPLSVAFVLLFACTSSPSPSKEPAASPTTPPATSPSSAGASALVAALPSGCEPGLPEATATVAFVASGRAWAVAPDGTGLTCLFDVADPGPFAWGPRADRVALAGLSVRGVGSAASRPSSALAPSYLSWGRPTGKALVFADGPTLQKAAVGSADVEDITPLEDVTYRDVAYHPSGLAIAFVVDGDQGSAIWLASNTGETPKRLVWSKSGTRFGALAFGPGGDALYYMAHAANGTRLLAKLYLSAGKVRQGLWRGDEDIVAVLPAPPFDLETKRLGAVVLNVGSECSDRRAVFSTLDGDEGAPVLPRATAPTAAAGWIDATTVLLAVGGCNGPTDLWTVSAVDGTSTLLVRDVTRGAVRVAEKTPPPPLPKLGVKSDFA